MIFEKDLQFLDQNFHLSSTHNRKNVIEHSIFLIRKASFVREKRYSGLQVFINKVSVVIAEMLIFSNLLCGVQNGRVQFS